MNLQTLFIYAHTSVCVPVRTTIPFALPLATTVAMNALPLQSPKGIRLVYILNQLILPIRLHPKSHNLYLGTNRLC
jgi:hypothetical protein